MAIYTNDLDFGSNNNVETDIFTQVWSQVQGEYLREFDYMANCASLDFSVGVSKDSVTFLWSGFNDVMPEYI